MNYLAMDDSTASSTLHPGQPERHSASMTSAEYRGCRFSRSVEGNGPPVLFVQGVGVAGSGWKPQVDALRSEYECLSFDNRGMGGSQPLGTRLSVEQMAEDALWLMDQAGWDSAHLVGHSLGGPIVMEMALRAPLRVRSLTLMCTVARGRDATRLSWPILWLGIKGRIGTLRSRRRAFLNIVMPRDILLRVDQEALAEELALLFGHDLADQPPVAMKQLAALRAYDATDRLSRLGSIPTLVLSAAHDIIAPPRFGRALAAGIPGARYVEFEEAAHGLPIQCSARVNELLQEHLSR